MAGDVVFQAVVDEETGGPGTRRAVERYRADAAIVLEPTARTIMPCEGGVEWLHVVVRGVSGHSALRYRSIHAGGRGGGGQRDREGGEAARVVQELERHWGNRKVHPLMPRGITTINPGLIEGGGLALSNMADECTLGLSLKYLPDERARGREARVRGAARRLAASDPWLRNHPPEIEWGIGGASFPPSELPLDHPLAPAVGDAFRTVIGEPEWRGFEAVSDLAWLAEAGVPGLLYGPGDAAQAHTTAEYVEIDDLVDATKVVALAARRLVRRRLTRQRRTTPPVTPSVWPVTYAASSEARNATAARDLGRARRADASGTRSTIARRASSNVVPACSAQTRMPSHCMSSRM